MSNRSNFHCFLGEDCFLDEGISFDFGCCSRKDGGDEVHYRLLESEPHGVHRWTPHGHGCAIYEQGATYEQEAT